jgi:hypothetical protein
MTAKGKLQGKLTLKDFELDGEGRVLCCPTGKEPREKSRRRKDSSDEFRGRYLASRNRSDHARFKYQMGMIRLRVRGIAKVTCTTMLRALGAKHSSRGSLSVSNRVDWKSWRRVRPSKASCRLKETSELADSIHGTNSAKNLGHASTKRKITESFCGRVNNRQYVRCFPTVANIFRHASHREQTWRNASIASSLVTVHLPGWTSDTLSFATLGGRCPYLEA